MVVGRGLGISLDDEMVKSDDQLQKQISPYNGKLFT